MSLNIPISRPTITDLEIKYVNDAIRSGWVSSLGNFVDRFEDDFSKINRVKHSISVSNGTSALHLAMLGLGIGEGDEVIVPNITFAACINAILYCKAIPVICDVNPDNFSMATESIVRLITPKTKAITAVHLYGLPVDISKLKKAISNKEIKIIEDCAEAHFSTVDNNFVGSLGDISTFSFYGNKTFTTGEGGMICVNDDHVASQIRQLRDHGMSKEKKYWHDLVGYNYRITNLQAALGCAQLERRGEITKDRARILKTYNNFFVGAKNIKVIFEGHATNISPVCWLYTIILEDIKTIFDRDLLIVKLKSKGIETRPVFYPLSFMPSYEVFKAEDKAASGSFYKGLCLPTYYGLSDSEIAYISNCIIDLLKA